MPAGSNLVALLYVATRLKREKGREKAENPTARRNAGPDRMTAAC